MKNNNPNSLVPLDVCTKITAKNEKMIERKNLNKREKKKQAFKLTLR